MFVTDKIVTNDKFLPKSEGYIKTFTKEEGRN